MIKLISRGRQCVIKNLMVGVIFCFVISILFLLVIIWEIKKSIDHDERVQQMSKKTNAVEVSDNRDFSIYETMVGDDGRENGFDP